MAFQGDSIYWVEVEKIVPNPFQPRREFDEQKLQELADSVRMYGILQPLTVTRKEIQKDDGTFYTEYELIAGERRLRASKLAGLSQVPVIIREGEDTEQEKLELAIIENLQREDLNAVDRALAFRQLSEVFGLSHTQVAKKVGRSREYVSNTIRLLALPDYILSTIRQGELTEGHARTLLMINDRPEELDVVFREILLKKLSVREVERIVRKIATDKMRKKKPEEYDAELIEIEKKLMETLGTRVEIQKTGFGGKIMIDYFSMDDLQEMLRKMDEVKFDASKEVPIVPVPEETDLMKILGYHTPLQGPEEVTPDPATILEDDSDRSENEAFESMEVEQIYVTAPKQSLNVSYLSPSFFHPNVVKPVVTEGTPTAPIESVPVIPTDRSDVDVEASVATPIVTGSMNQITEETITPMPVMIEREYETQTPVPVVVASDVPPVVPPFSQTTPHPMYTPNPTVTPVPTVSVENQFHPHTPAQSEVIPPVAVYSASIATETQTPVTSPVAPTPINTTPAPVPVVEKKEDDGDLYSIKNFSI